MSAATRVRQFVRAVGAWFQPEDAAQAATRGYLPAAGCDLFWSMPHYDRHHALRVVQMLEEQGHRDPDLVAAALLHDAGKTAGPSRPLRLWHRVTVVLMKTFAPGLLERVAQDRPGSWRQPFFVQLQHGQIGAELALEAGCSSRTAELIRHHEDPPGANDDPLLVALQSADGAD
jgi:hypothetical protein